jgi:PKD repeat protein
VLAPNDAVVDGPNAGIVSLNGMSIARDGTGGLVYLKAVAGVAHVFVSILQNGAFQPPIQVDAGLLATSSQPVIAAGNKGTLLVGFVNNGALYIAQRVNGGAFAPPALLYPAAANPAISMSNFGKAYLAFTATNGAGGGDVRAAYYYAGGWGLEPTPLDDNPADQAGMGTGRPQVTTAGDGVGIVIWGENGHIYTRRVVKTTASVVDEQADVPSLNGWREVSASNPVIGAGGDSSYASVAFQEMFSSGASRQSRVLMNRLHGSQYDGIQQGDGVGSGGPEGADQPQTSVTEFGDGWVVSEHDQSHQLYATSLGNNDSFGSTLRVDSLANATPPDAVSSNAGLTSTFIAWQQEPGVAGTPEIRLRYAPGGSDLGPEQVVSSPALGAPDADLGLRAAGDVAGDAAVAWLQGSGASTRIVAAQLFQPPGAFVPARSFEYSTLARPLLSWSASSELWGGPQYVVKIDGVVAGQTTATAFVPPVPLADGRRVYQVSAVNQAGLATSARAATVFVDTVPPRVSLKISGTRAVGDRIHLTAHYSDPPPPGLPKSAASGVATVFVGWGDRTAPSQIRRTTASHVYKRRHTYTVTVTVTDRAGNKTVVRKRLVIAATGPKHRPKGKTKKAIRMSRHR